MDGFHLALAFSLGLLAFLGICALFACRDEPLDDALSDWPDGLCGDLPCLPRDDEPRFHDERK